MHFLDRGERVTVFTRWPDVFADLPITVKSLDERSGDIRQVAFSHHIELSDRSVGQFVMRCRQAGIMEPVDLKLRWTVRNQGLLDKIKYDAAGRKIFIYQPRKALKDSALSKLVLNRAAFNEFVKSHRGFYRIKLGHPPQVVDDADLECELDLYGKGFICDTFDVCTIGDLFFGEGCFIQTIAEALDKPTICMFSRRASMSKDWLSHFTPEWQFHKKHLGTAVYDEPA